jgi:hypothetical protein
MFFVRSTLYGYVNTWRREWTRVNSLTLAAASKKDLKDDTGSNLFI